MGKDLQCAMEYRGERLQGRVYLESDFLLFRGDVRLKILFTKMAFVSAGDGWLRIGFESEEASFEIGNEAAKWAEKILHPPSRKSKLGLKSGVRVFVVGEFDADFLTELTDTGVQLVAGEADLIFLAADKRADLKMVSTLQGDLRSKSAMWVVYPKAVERIRETDVIGCSRDCGWKDTKVVAFSKTHTALRFIRG